MMERIDSPEKLKELQSSLEKSVSEDRRVICVCGGSGCRAFGSADLFDAFKKGILEEGLDSDVEVRMSGCHGFCEMGSIVLILPENIFYVKVKPENVSDILEKTVKGGEVIEKLCYRGPDRKLFEHYGEIPFYKNQKRLVLELNGMISPTEIKAYISHGGYSAAAKALTEMEPEQIIDEISSSGLRGRGGGGFPTGRKWATARKAESDDGVRYVICNADEGDPGAFMDRSVLEGNPHSVIEGMIVCSKAVGSEDGYVYVRAEYPLAVEHLTKAIRDAEEAGLLGQNILGTGHNFKIMISRGAGAFVCGESTALMASIEGKVGRPRAKYVHTVEKGLWQKPTVLNNVETFANVPIIINNGAAWYGEIGTENSKGTKIFSLVGKINNTGLVEVPMGITLREIIYDIGGGIPRGKKFKAVQTGGPSGGCIPESMLDLSVDYDELTKAGSMMGSGGMIVMDEDTCMVDVARYFLNFLKGESCGKCVPCREGVARMHEILTRICEGEGKMEDLDILTEMGAYLADSALCALGSTAANPVLTTLKYFRDEYEAHINEKYCPAGVCKSLFAYEIDADACVGCTACAKGCPAEAIEGEKKKSHRLIQENCIMCGNCYEVCRFGAVQKKRKSEVVA